MKRSKWGLILLAVTAGIMLIAAGCANDDDNAAEVTDQEALQQLMLEDAEMENADAFWGDDDLGGLDEPINPVHWGRRGVRQLVSVNVEIEDDSFATITRTISFNGEFRVVDEVNDTTHTLYVKPMYNSIVRKAHAIRVDRSRYPRHNWRITEVTPAVLVSAAPNPHTIEPTRVEVYQSTEGGLELIADVSDPLNTYFNRENLPTVNANTEVTVYAHANTLEPAAAFLHPHVFRMGRHPRLPLNDNGEGADEIAGDGIYSGAYMTGDYRGVFVSGFDFLDYETLFDSEGSYDSGGWAIPYRVVVGE